MKSFHCLLVSCALFLSISLAQAATTDQMTLALSKSDQPTIASAVATVSSIPGVVSAKSDEASGNFIIEISGDSKSETRKAVRDSLKKEGIKFKVIRPAKSVETKAETIPTAPSGDAS